ncbi:MAG TPA: PP2C family protein-serine/threonine phosphatase [Acidobacteriota bacterium]|nr:PP2C family protein-serine/threonine phosphatase [Acidobacteriota bacterium]
MKKKPEKTNRLLEIVKIRKLLNSTLRLERILQIILETATKSLMADRGTVYIIDEKKKELWSKVLQGDVKVEIRLPIGKGIAGYVAKTGKTIIIKDAYKDPRFNPEVDKRTGYTTKTMLCTPMKDRKGKKIGVIQIVNKLNGHFSKEDIKFLDLLSLDACLAIENSRLFKEALEKERIEKELEVAASIQKMILPKTIPNIDGFEIAGLNVPSKQVGGDYYDVISLNNGKLALVIADASGKGVPAALLISTLHACLRAYLESSLKLEELMQRVNSVILKSSTENKFITFFMAVLDPQSKTIEVVNAGHYPPVIIRNCNLIKLLNTGVVLGCMEGASFKRKEIPLQSNDAVVMFTDGITEACNTKNQPYGDERLEKLLLENCDKPPHQLKQMIYNDVKAFEGSAEQSDDITLLILKVK